MGGGRRWRRSKKNRNNKQQRGADFSQWTTRCDLVAYLEAYRQGCEDYYNKNSNTISFDDECSDGENNASSVPKEDLNNGSSIKAYHQTNNMIAGVEFPKLDDDNDDVFGLPYLKLPPLTPRQRKAVHDCCVEADLYHESYDDDTETTVQDDSYLLMMEQHANDSTKEKTPNTAAPTISNGNICRSIVISAYADGFDGIPQLQHQNIMNGINKSSTAAPKKIASPYKHRPWFCRRTIDSVEEEDSTSITPIKSNSSTTATPQEVAKEQALIGIFKLIDQPGDCLREEHDILVYDTLGKASLADVEPPSSGDASSSSSSDCWMLVDTAAAMQQCTQELTKAATAAQPNNITELAFDVEAYNISKYTQLTCLLQITTNAGKEYIIDTLAPGVWEHVHGLAPLFADPNIVKIGHSIGGLDGRSLHRDFGIFVVNVFDTYEAAKVLGLRSHGLAAVCKHYGLQNSDVFLQLKENYQAGDWRCRPLTEGMIQYARYDVHYLIRLRWLMMRDLCDNVWGMQQSGVVTTLQQEQLIAESLQETLKQIELAEDDVVVENGVTTVVTPEEKKDALDFFIGTNSPTAAGVGGDYGDDAASFFTSRERSRSDDNFYTPDNSFHNLTFQDDDEDDDDDEFDKVVNTDDITAAQLRMQPRLMRCLSISQERCRDMWSGKSEPHHHNALFLDLIKRSKRGFINDWTTPCCEELYDDLVQWREIVADELECLPGFLVSLTDLVAVAWKRPTTKYSLRRITYQLPDFLQDNHKYLDQMLDIVLRKTLQDGGAATSTVFLYSNLKVKSDVQHKGRGLSTSSSSPPPQDNSYWDMAIKVFVAGALCTGFATAILDAERRRRR